MRLFLLIIIISNLAYSNTERDLARKIFKTVRCIACKGQSIDDSNSVIAVNLKKVIIKQVNEGKSRDEIEKFLIEKYGENIILKPSFNQSTWFIWIAPLIFILIGAFLIFRMIIS